MIVGVPLDPRRPLHYCACYVNEHRLGTYDAGSLREALRLACTGLMVIAINLDEEPCGEARA